MKTIATALWCWILFLLTDLAVFVGYMIYNASDGLELFPNTFLCFFLLLLYTSTGICVGLTAVVISFFTEKIPPFRLLSKYLPITLSLSANSLCTLVILSKSGLLPFFNYLAGYRLLLVSAVCFALFFMFFTGCIYLLGRRFKEPFACLCISVEVCWCFARIATLRSGMLENFFKDVPISSVLALGTMAGAVVFLLLYWCSAKLHSAVAKRLAFKITGGILFIVLMYVAAQDSLALSEKTTSDKPNIVLIIMDTVRADHLSCYGYSKQTTPNIDAFARESTQYKKAYATSCWTLPSIASLLTGLYPSGHGAHRVNKPDGSGGFRGLKNNQTTLAKTLKQAGYQTAGFISSSFPSSQFGLHQGFDYFDDDIPIGTWRVMPTFGLMQFFNFFLPIKDYFSATGHDGYRIASQINTAALSWLEKNLSAEPFFLLLHYFDAHDPYLPQKPGVNNVPAAIRQINDAGPNYIDMEIQILYQVITGEKTLSVLERDYLIGNYDRGIRLLDEKIGELFTALKRHGLYEDSIIIVTSDHGESFGEHNLMVHGISLYQDNLHVPLIIKGPSPDKRHSTVEYPVSLAGLMPSLLTELAIEQPMHTQGAPFSDSDKQLILAMNFYNGDHWWPDAYATDSTSLIHNGFKLIRFKGSHDQLFNINEDPYETNNLIEKESAVKDHLAKTMDESLNRTAPINSEPGGAEEIGGRALLNLKNLGYIQ